jgi:Fe-S-cluster-containing dehydrogenase component
MTQRRDNSDKAGPDEIERAVATYPQLERLLRHPTERRGLLRLLAAGVALGGLSGCGDPAAPDGRIVPAVIAPPGIIPGVPNFYATASVVNGSAIGILVEHQMGRPIKVEGNPEHPSSLGATDAIAQAMLLDFYDPDRSGGMQTNGDPADRQGMLTMLAALRPHLATTSGAGLRILTGTVASPTLGGAIDGVLKAYPEARWHQWERVSRDAVRAGAMLAYGRPVEIVPDLTKADVVVALDSDLLGSAPGHVRYGRDFAARRNPTRGRMSRVYAVEPFPSLIGTQADHRIVAGPREMHAGLMALTSVLLRNGQAGDAPGWVAPIIEDLRGAQGHAFIHLGPDHPPEAHALVHAMNEVIGARESTMRLIESPEYRAAEQAADMRALIEDMQAGRVETLVILDSNPAFAMPGFAEAMKRVKQVITLAPSLDETGIASTWFIPVTHAWESWSDARAHDGTATILQPQALPLYAGTDPLVFLSLLTGADAVNPMAAVQQTWRDRLADANAWNDALAHGVVPNSASAHVTSPLRGEALQTNPPAPPVQDITVLFRPDPHLWDGRFANNPWLQELPRPFTHTVWDNPLLLPPKLAHDWQLRNGDHAELRIGANFMPVPVWTVPGQAADVVVVQYGFGRRVVGDVGKGAGFDFFTLIAETGTPALRKVHGHTQIASTDHRDPMVGDSADIARRTTLATFTANPKMFEDPHEPDLIYRRHPPGPVAWGMSIDLNACIGCNACVVACMAENNVPVVGKANVLRQREMHWLRIDRYYEGPEDAPETYLQPMLCMHCEQAPCEVVCPVEATVHDQEGINVMVYNRCVGTRFCSNNCPYKVRRFNYFAFTEQEPRPAISRNPDVSVRGRGVMEKCNFCLQRIAEARIAADRDGTPERVATACQAACPTQAFTFGNIADAQSDVTARKKSPLDYKLLPEEATYPRVTYEARVRNSKSGVV